MQRLEAEGVRGADLVFACIGPALEIYSRYRRVETPDGHEITLHEYLERVWEVVGREALKQVLGTAEAQARNGAAGALEEDARLTALFLWTIQGTAETADNGFASEPDEDDEAPQGKASGFSLPLRRSPTLRPAAGNPHGRLGVPDNSDRKRSGQADTRH